MAFYTRIIIVFHREKGITNKEQPVKSSDCNLMNELSLGNINACSQ